MSAFPPVDHLEAPAALAAFLRGVERRGAVLAELQCGDVGTGDVALAAAMRGFRAAAAALPMADWPATFWARLLAQPQLRHRTALALPLDATDNLAELGSGPRVALLLRLAAGLGEADAAAALGVAEPTYRLALRRALPHRSDGSPDPEAWQRLHDQVHHRIKTLPQGRLLRLARAREAALLGEPAAPPPPTERPAAAAGPRWVLPALWTLLTLCVGAFAATFWRSAPEPWSAEDMRVRRRALPPAEAPAARYGRDAGLIAHGDFALLTDPMAEANTRDLDFYSWLAAQQATAGATDPSLPANQDAALLPATAATAALDANAAAETRDAPH